MMLHSLLILLLLAPAVNAIRGYIKNKASGDYLHCDNGNCVFTPDKNQIFTESPGHDGYSRFRISLPDGSDTGSCLDREHCHSGDSNSRLSSCDHCGSYHWRFESSTGKLAEDHMKNCIQDNGRVDHCGDSHAVVEFEDPDQCKIERQVLTNLKCKNPNGAGQCVSRMADAKGTAGAQDNQDCNNCFASGTLDCAFSFDVASTSSVTNAVTSSSTVGIKIGTEIEMDLEFVDVKESYSVSISKTFTHGKSTEVTNQRRISSTCTEHVPPHTWERSEATFVTGTVLGDYTGDLITTYTPSVCNIVKEHVDGQITITNVPTSTMIGSCTPHDVQCPSATNTTERLQLAQTRLSKMVESRPSDAQA